jgi:hypothetical protein
MEFVLDELQHTVEGEVHNVAHKITKGIKYKVCLSQISLYNLISNYTKCFGHIFCHHKVLFLEKYYCCSLNMST